MREGNLLIRASAGTGKTFSLATRYLRLMLLDEVAPEKIVALTFSCAAAQEIYTKILERLWTAAKTEENAARESKEICKGLGIDQAWGTTTFVDLLRRLLDTQHLGTIATLDSFILRMVRNFPLEMGFQHAVEVLDPSGEDEAVQDALREILNSSSPKDAAAFIKVFSATQEGYLPRVLQYKIESMLKTWREFVEGHPDCRKWTVASMCAALGIHETSVCPDLSGVNTEGAYNPAVKFIKLAQPYDGTEKLFPDNKTGEMMRHLVQDPRSTSFSWTTDGGIERFFEYGEDGAAAIRAAIRHMFNVYVQRQLTKVKANLDFIGFIEDAYNRISRRKGKLTFSDFTAISATKDSPEKKLALENLEYRFDEKFDHWALDEFQDTSELQWKCLRDLVASATSGGGRTVMTVGDLKQSIYTWRGGNDAPFTEMMKWESFTDPAYGRITDNSTSYRYEQNICTFINAVFGPNNLQASGVLPRERAEAIDLWLSPKCWKEHQPDFKDGQPKANDYVKVLGVSDPEGKANIETLLPALEEELRRIWEAHEACQNTETVGILVRKNDDGNAIAEYLRAKGFPVVWEGLSAVSDVPAVNALIDLLRLSEHPEDTFAWETVSQLFPICSTLFPPPKDGKLEARYVSALVARSLSHRGLSRTLQEYCRALSVDAVGLDPLSKQRLREMVGLAVAYEQRNASRFSIDGFETFLAVSSKRELGASSHVVRILSIHRSKGLTLDRVIVPLPEGTKEGIANPGNRGLLSVPKGPWVLPQMSAELAALNPETAKARNRLADEELLSNIRMYYVALTRARKAMYVLLPLAETKTADPFFRDVIVSAFAGYPRKAAGEDREIVYEGGIEPAFKKSEATNEEMGNQGDLEAWHHEDPANPIERVSPSSAGHAGYSISKSGRTAADLFDEDAGAAAKKGIEIHGQYEAIEWADADALAQLPPAFHVAFTKPSPEATVWREKSYEIYRGEKGRAEWETGQFDRVVFSGTGDDRRAVIYDFKTNAKHEDESVEEFEDRLLRLYAGQMAMYVAALARLTGIPESRIEAKLLATATMSVIAVR